MGPEPLSASRRPGQRGSCQGPHSRGSPGRTHVPSPFRSFPGFLRPHAYLPQPCSWVGPCEESTPTPVGGSPGDAGGRRGSSVDEKGSRTPGLRGPGPPLAFQAGAESISLLKEARMYFVSRASENRSMLVTRVRASVRALPRPWALWRALACPRPLTHLQQRGAGQLSQAPGRTSGSSLRVLADVPCSISLGTHCHQLPGCPQRPAEGRLLGGPVPRGPTCSQLIQSPTSPGPEFQREGEAAQPSGSRVTVPRRDHS